MHADKVMNDLTPFSVTLEPYLEAIGATRTEIEKLANLETMTRIKGRNPKAQPPGWLWIST